MRVLITQALCIATFVLYVSFLLDHTRLVSLDSVVDALPKRLFIPIINARMVVILDGLTYNFNGGVVMLVTRGTSTCCFMIFVSFILIGRANSLQTLVNRSFGLCSSSSMWVAVTATSANSSLY